MTYDRRAIMLNAHRDYASRVAAVTAHVEQQNAAIKRSRAQFKPALRSLADALRSLWKTCLRGAWQAAKNAIRWAQPVVPASAIQVLRDQLLYIEAADRGYDANRAARLRAEIAGMREAA